MAPVLRLLGVLVVGSLAYVPSQAFVPPAARPRAVGQLAAGKALPFSDTMYEAMKDVFSVVSLRVKEGHLRRADFQRLERAVNFIVAATEQSLGREPSPPSTFSQVVPQTAAPVPAPPAAPSVPAAAAAPVQAAPAPSVPQERDDVQRANAGYGLAPGTKNTYIIEGMDDMTPTEYRLAMNQKIIDDKKKRMKEGGAIGNMAFHDYMRELQGDDNYDGPMRFENEEVE